MIYLLHFDRPINEIHRAQHYIGYARNVAERVALHRSGTAGVRFSQVAHERAIGFSVARIWTGDRSFERKLKRRHNHAKLCPICRGEVHSEGRHNG